MTVEAGSVGKTGFPCLIIMLYQDNQPEKSNINPKSFEVLPKVKFLKQAINLFEQKVRLFCPKTWCTRIWSRHLF